MLNLIKEIKIALDYNLFHVALGMALTLPDICGNIEFKETKVKKRYIDWCNSYLYNQGFINNDKKVISGEDCYLLRCAVLHSNNLKLKENRTFLLRISSTKDKGIYTESQLKESSKYIELDIRHLCHILCNAAEEYYQQHTEKKDFEEHNYKILDIQSFFEKLKI